MRVRTVTKRRGKEGVELETGQAVLAREGGMYLVPSNATADETSLPN